jgi:hypothetical protein
MRYAAWNRSGRVRVLRLPSWQIAVVLTLALALGLAIAVVATGVFLVGLPVAILAVVAYRLFGGRGWNRRARRENPGVIEGEYEVIDGDGAPRWNPHENGRNRAPR